MDEAIFAGGCFWCMEAVFQKQNGVIKVVSGYTGGTLKSPTYNEVSGGQTGHYEAVLITYNPKKISYETLLDFFWRNIDPTDAIGQFADKGNQYKTAIFYNDENQKNLAEKTKKELMKKYKIKIATEILPAKEFYPAENYHQNFCVKNRVQYSLYKIASGRDEKLEAFWSKD
jgi:peptide methionine sulfoxide reductase msrA/msrB